MNQLIVLDVEVAFGEQTNTIHPALLKDDRELILVDCGYPHFLPNIKQAAAAKGVALDGLTKIIITHHDYDHMGALAEFKESYPHINILASPEEAEYICGRSKSLRLQQAEAIYDTLPEDQREGARRIQALFAAVRPAQVDVRLRDGMLLPSCGGIEIVSTPGHMPGHIALYLRAFKALIAGDALAIQDGKLSIANPEYTLDMATAKQSICKLLNYDIQSVICYHGGVVDTGVRAALEKIAQ